MKKGSIRLEQGLGRKQLCP